MEAVDHGLGFADAAVVGVEPLAVEFAFFFVDDALEWDFPLAAEGFDDVGTGFAGDEDAIGAIGQAGWEVKIDFAVFDADGGADLRGFPAQGHGVGELGGLHTGI